MARWWRLGAAILILVLALMPRQPATAQQDQRFVYQDLPPTIQFPATAQSLNSAIIAGDTRATRRHAWSLWEGLTTPSASRWNGQVLPIFETWYSIPEVFTDAYTSPPNARPRAFSQEFQPPTQVQIARRGQGVGADLLSFVKFNEPAAMFIWQQNYYLKSTLTLLGASFDAQKTPAQLRQIQPFPNSAVAIKLVYWLVKNPASSQAERGLTALPYWDPSYPPPPGGVPPTHLTWPGCVAIDPAGSYPAGSRQPVNCNGTLAAPRIVDAPVVPLSTFYSYRLSDERDVANARLDSTLLSGGFGEQERFVTNPGQVPEIGDYVILLAMHVTTKEIDNWAFQTFWWSPNPNARGFGDDRPASIQGPWANFQMCTAYDMVVPREPDGGPAICFNPYLESDLGPTTPYVLDGTTYPADPMAGTRSNCQSCHMRAGYPAFAPGGANFGRTFNTGYLAPDDPYFDTLVKTDFLWSIALQAQPK